MSNQRIPIEWDESWSVGVKAIDDDHKTLFTLFNHVHSALEEGEGHEVLGRALAAMVEYTDYHFRREERMMEVVGFSELGQHQQLHDRLRDRVLAFQERYQSDPGSVDFDEFSAFLSEWLVDHIKTEDMAYRPHVEGNAEAQKALESFGFIDYTANALAASEDDSPEE